MRHLNLATVALVFLAFHTQAQTVQDGWRAFDNERYTESKEIFSKRIAREPSNALFYYHKGRIHDALGEKDSAKICFDKGLVLNPKSAHNMVGLGKLRLDMGDTIGAKDLFDKAAVASGKKDAYIVALTGEAYATTTGKKNLGRAFTFLEKAAQMNSKDAEIQLIRGDAYAQDPNQGGKAISSYENAATLSPSPAKAWTKIGDIYVGSRNYDEANAAYEKAVQADPNYAPAHREQAELHSLNRRYIEAAASYKKYLGIVPTTKDNLTRYAQLLFLSKDYAGTIETTNKVLALDASNPILKRLIGYSYYEMEKYPEGLASIETFFKEVDPKKIVGSDHAYYARLLEKSGNIAQAIESYKTAIGMDSTQLDWYGELGQLYYKEKKFTESAQAYEAKMKQSRETSVDWFMAGRSYYYGQSLQKADSAFSRVSELSPTSHLGFMWRGRVQSQLDATDAKDSAKPFYEKTVELATLSDPVKYKKDLVEAYQFLGFNAVQHDDNANALAMFQKILELDPGNKDATKYIDQLKNQ